jgi:hypothetical protein
MVKKRNQEPKNPRVIANLEVRIGDLEFKVEICLSLRNGVAEWRGSLYDYGAFLNRLY